MPSPPTTELPVPKSWDEFEDIAADVLKRIWETPYVTRNGRSGQEQHGVDIYGLANHLGGFYAGAQCKRYDRQLTIAQIDKAIADAKRFAPPLREFIIITSTKRDATLQEHIRLVNVAQQQNSLFVVQILFWEDLCLELCGDKRLLGKHFPDWSRLSDPIIRPELDVNWIAPEGFANTLQIEPINRRLRKLNAILMPYLPDEIERINRKNPEDAKIAERFNVEVSSCLANEELVAAWHASQERARFEAGHQCGIVLECRYAKAVDVVVTLRFESGLRVYALADPPDAVDAPLLPKRPSLSSDREPLLEQILSTSAWAIPGVNMPSRFLEAAREFESARALAALRLNQLNRFRPGYIITGRSIEISPKGNGLKIKVRELPPRQPVSFEGEDDGIVLVPETLKGKSVVTWTADASNCEAPSRGTLEVAWAPKI